MLLLVFCTSVAYGQGRKNGVFKAPKDWHLRSFEKDSLYGAGVYDAYEYLKGREPKRKVVVAVIDGGTGHGSRGFEGLFVDKRGRDSGERVG